MPSALNIATAAAAVGLRARVQGEANYESKRASESSQSSPLAGDHPSEIAENGSIESENRKFRVTMALMMSVVVVVVWSPWWSRMTIGLGWAVAVIRFDCGR